MGASDGRERSGVAIGGFMGTGKSTVGRVLASRLGLPFVDMDEVLTRRHGPIESQFAHDGEAVFRAREKGLLVELCEGAAAVVATGGGAWVDANNRARLRAAMHTVTLDAPLEVLRARVPDGEGRPLWAAAEALYASRRAAYADAELSIDVSERTSEQVAAVVASAFFGAEVEVDLGERSYPVVLDPGGYNGLIDRLRAALPQMERAFLVTDDNVGPLWADEVMGRLRGAGVAVERIVIAAGEVHKTLATWSAVLDVLLTRGVDRRTPILALGGGVVGDITGFVAATALRGVPFVQLPTTLLAMVDSSVGGKTAVNHATGKNLVGAFHQPALVYASLPTLSTLPAVELRAGLGEVVKTALIGGQDLFEALERDADALREGRVAALAPVIARCVNIKAEVVARDEREGGWRAVLNLGHTVGHGLERAAGYGCLRHGEAVALGLVAEVAWGLRHGHCTDSELPERLRRLHGRLGLPKRAPQLQRSQIVTAMQVDKKARRDKIVMPIVVRLGQLKLVDVPIDGLSQLLEDVDW